MATRRSTRISSDSGNSFKPEPPSQQQLKKMKLENSNNTVQTTVASAIDEFRNGSLSEYELTRLENIKRNEQFLSNLGLNEAKLSLDTVAAEKKPTKRGVSKSIRLHTSIEAPSRRSGRVTVDRLKAELQELQKDANNAELIKQKEEELSDLLTKRYESSYTSVIDSNYNQEDVVRVDKGPVSFSDCLNKHGAALQVYEVSIIIKLNFIYALYLI